MVDTGRPQYVQRVGEGLSNTCVIRVLNNLAAEEIRRRRLHEAHASNDNVHDVLAFGICYFVYRNLNPTLADGFSDFRCSSVVELLQVVSTERSLIRHTSIAPFFMEPLEGRM